jgi:hypothetical protein
VHQLDNAVYCLKEAIDKGLLKMVNLHGYVIVEVKADNRIEDAVVQAKENFARQIAVVRRMEYRIIRPTDAYWRHYRNCCDAV